MRVGKVESRSQVLRLRSGASREFQLPGDFRPDSLRSENLQENCVRSAAINEVNLFHSSLQSLRCRTNLGDHSS